MGDLEKRGESAGVLFPSQSDIRGFDPFHGEKPLDPHFGSSLVLINDLWVPSHVARGLGRAPTVLI